MTTRSTRTWTPTDAGEDDLAEDLSVRDRSYESFGEQGLAIPTYLPEPYELEDDPMADVASPLEPARGAERVDLGEALTANLQPAARLRARDAQLRDAVHERLRRDGTVDPDRVDVIVHDGQITLSGDVDDVEQRAHVVELASRLRGVTDIDNRLRIGRPTGHGAPPSRR